MSKSIGNGIMPIVAKKGKVSVRDTMMENLLSLIEGMNDLSLNLPRVPKEYLSITIVEDESKVKTFSEEAKAKLAESGIVEATIVAATQLTALDSSVKKTLQLTLEFKDHIIPYEPGDSFGFFCCNPPDEVSSLLQRLGWDHAADALCEIKSCDKKLALHIPMYTTLRHVLTSCVDIRHVPKKAYLRLLASYARDEKEHDALKFLSSKQGSSFYREHIREKSLSIFDVLERFKSCNPPISSVLEHLPALKPRFYSVASSSLLSEKRFRIIFNVISVPCDKKPSIERKGVCTGWFERLTKEMIIEQSSATKNTDSSCSSSFDHQQSSISLYKRQNKNFLLPNDTSLPLIMIGPGTGVAPFLGFLQHREYQMEKSGSKSGFGETWLFYGCRHKEKDFLCREELEQFHSNGVLSHLVVCFSQDESPTQEPRHVQDNITKYSQSIIQAIDVGGVIYVCGDAKQMRHDVREAFIKVFMNEKKFSENEAKQFLKKLEEEKRYLVDVWI